MEDCFVKHHVIVLFIPRHLILSIQWSLSLRDHSNWRPLFKILYLVLFMLFIPPMRDHLPWETTIWSSLGVHGLTRQGPLQSKCGQNDCSYIQLKLGHLWHFILTFVWSVDYVTGLVHPADYTTSLVHPEINAVCLHTSRPAFKLLNARLSKPQLQLLLLHVHTRFRYRSDNDNTWQGECLLRGLWVPLLWLKQGGHMQGLQPKLQSLLG